MADDAGALLVRSGLVSSSALDEARAWVASHGGTLGEQLVVAGAIADDALTDFYRSRLLVPQVNPNSLARLPVRVIAAIPSDMAIELRSVPVALDGDNNLTVAMSDPSDRHAVDEIAFFTGAYVVRAVATQMQIAWCLAHYYGHVTALGQRLLQPSTEPAGAPAAAAVPAPKPAPPAPIPRAKGLTGKVNATRHRAVAPVTGPVDLKRPLSGPLDLGGLSRAAGAPGGGAAAVAATATATATAAAEPPSASAGPPSAAAEPRAAAAGPRAAAAGPPSASAGPPAAAAGPPSASPPAATAGPPAATAGTAGPPAATAGPPAATAGPPAAAAALVADPAVDLVAKSLAADPAPALAARGTPEPEPEPDRAAAEELGAASSPELAAEVPDGGVVERPRARSVSGEIRVPPRRAASIKPPLPELDDEDDDEPQITVQVGPDDDSTGPRMVPLRRPRRSEPPELLARAGEVDVASGPVRMVDIEADQPRIIVSDDELDPPDASGELRATTPRDAPATPTSTIEIADDAGNAVVIHDQLDRGSEPVLLDRRRAGELRPPELDDDIVVLDARKPPRPRPDKPTVIGVGVVPAITRVHRDTEATGVPAGLHDGPTAAERDPTRRDARPAPFHDEDTDETFAAPPPHDDDTNPRVLAPPLGEDDLDDDELDGHRVTNVMSANELDDAIPHRQADPLLVHAPRRRVDYDPTDDGWGPPGTTIPPPLLGAIPGVDDDDLPTAGIPMADVDDTPLIVAPPAAPEPARSSPAIDASGSILVRALEDSTARAIDLIRALEHARERDEVVRLMIAHLAESHRRAGFFSIKPDAAKVNELGVHSMVPVPSVLPVSSLRLDRPSTLQDVVGTRLPYRGPMHDDASRTFLSSVLGACPPEILLVPVAIRERVVGVLFGEHRMRHTFDDQLALAARAAGMALERILKSKRT